MSGNNKYRKRNEANKVLRKTQSDKADYEAFRELRYEKSVQDGQMLLLQSKLSEALTSDAYYQSKCALMQAEIDELLEQIRRSY